MKTIRVFILLLFAFAACRGVSLGKNYDAVIQDGKKVTLEYTVTVEGKVVDSSKKHGPLRYTHGKASEIIPGLARQLKGLRAGDSKTIIVTPQEGYGEINPKAFKQIDRKNLPKALEVKLDKYIQIKRSDGKIISARIADIKDTFVVLDYNHPFASKTLYFKVKVVSVK
ncbi:MAG: FKBP-type peptidyl-prolyl cis-trans isomerase [Candidatus Omnitrophota bacterium]|jgi:FKBP-type peptidyl-prolyl cis-trans isomerase SlyD